MLRADKGGPWKAVYHEVRALLNAADALRSLDTASDPGAGRESRHGPFVNEL